VRKPPQYGQQGQGQGQGQEQASLSSQRNQRQFFRNQVLPQHGQHQNTGQLQCDPNAIDVDRNQAQRPPLKCFKCNGLGHMARDCQRQLDGRVLRRNEGCCKGPQRTREEEGFSQCGSVKAFPLKLQNKFEGLEIDDSDTNIVDTGCTTPMNEASFTEHGTAKACLIPHQKNYIVTICYVKRFISKLKEHISWLKPKHYFVWTVQPQSELMISVGLCTMNTHHMVDVKALLDSGAIGMVIDKKFAEGNGIVMWILDKPIWVYNADGTLNQEGSITHGVTLMLLHKGHKEKAVFEVCDLGKSTVIIGYIWLWKHNPEIDWKTGDISSQNVHENAMLQLRNASKRKHQLSSTKHLLRKLTKL